MAFTGRLDELTPPEIFELFSLTRKSGELVLHDGERRGVVVFRDGKIVFAASDSLHSAVSDSLIQGGVVGDASVVEGSAYGESPEEDDGGLIVRVDEGEPGALTGFVHEQIETIVSELVSWRSGSFVFEGGEVPVSNEINLTPGRFYLEEGVDSMELLLQAMRKLDESSRQEIRRELDDAQTWRQSQEGASSSEISSAFELLVDETSGGLTWRPEGGEDRSGGSHGIHLRRLFQEMRRMGGLPASFTAELTLLILRFAAQILNRGVLFAVRPDGFQGIGQFGLQFSDSSPDTRVRDLKLPHGGGCALSRVLDSRQIYRGNLAGSVWNQELVDRLGGTRPLEAVAVPLLLDSDVVAILYGDNLPEMKVIGSVDGLEVLMREIGLAAENARSER